MTKPKPYFLHEKDWQPKSIKIEDTTINFVPMLRDKEVTFDSSLSFNQHVINTCGSAFLELRHIGLIGNS